MKTIMGMGLWLLALGTFVAAGGTGAPKKEEMPKYIEMLKKSQSAKDRALAADMIGRRGAIQVNDVKEGIPLLQKAVVKDIDPMVRKNAAEALGKIATDPENSIPPLREALKKDKSDNVKLAAINALGAYGPEAREAVPDIREFLKTQNDKQTKKIVADALGKILGKKKKDN